MPITLTPVTTTVLTKDDVRVFLRDKAENNILLDQVQFTDDELDRAINFTVDYYNSVPPLGTASVDTIPKNILLIGVCSWLMRSESFLQVRNQATYNDGDIGPIGLDDKVSIYDSLSQQLKNEFMLLTQQYKTAQNMESAYGSLGSGYRWVPRTR